MKLTREQLRIIKRVMGVIEVGKAEGGYDDVTVLKDGPGKIAQVTYGRFQTTEYGNLPALLERYIRTGGVFAWQLDAFLPRLARRGQSEVASDKTFKGLLARAGKEDPIMAEVQEKFFDDFYFAPAMKWADENGFKTALSALVIFDSFIQSGRVRMDIRNRFPEYPPAHPRGDEKAWIRAYLRERQEWLAEIGWKSTTYRTRCFLEQARKENWDLSQLPIRVNGVNVR
jgi:chitosanase